MSTNNPTLYENFQRVRDWSESKFAYKSDIPADLSSYVTKTELSDMSYATQTYVSDAIAAIPGVDLSAYATKSYVAEYVATYAPQPDLSAYVTKTELSNAGYITSIPSEYITQDELSANAYITNEDLGKDIVPIKTVTYSLGNSSYNYDAVYTKSVKSTGYNLGIYANGLQYLFLQENVIHPGNEDVILGKFKEANCETAYASYIYIDNVNIKDIYATKTYVADYVNTYAPTPDLSAYVTKTELSNAGYITSIPSEYVTDAELSGCGYATQTYVSDAIAAIPVVDLSAYVTKTELSNAGYITSIPSEYVTDAELSAKGYLTAVPNTYPTYAAISNMAYVSQTALSGMGYLTSVPSEYVTDAELSAKGYLTAIPDTYATKTYVADYVNTYAPTPDLSAYVTKTELSNAGYITSIPSEYITDTELSACGYLTAVPNTYPTYSAISAMSYATIAQVNAIFTYDSSTGTLTITTIS